VPFRQGPLRPGPVCVWERVANQPASEQVVTPKELAVLRALSCEDVGTFLPADNSPEQLREFDELVELLYTLERCGWIELKVMKRDRGRSGRHQPRYAGAAARCTEQGREALRLLGEA